MVGTIGVRRYCGTASRAFKGAAYKFAGKTGTAQVFTVAQNEKYNAKITPERLRDHAWFIAFAPAEAPRIAVAVLVENGGFGASAAAPDRTQGAGCLSAGCRRQGEADLPTPSMPAQPAEPTLPESKVATDPQKQAQLSPRRTRRLTHDLRRSHSRSRTRRTLTGAARVCSR